MNKTCFDCKFFTAYDDGCVDGVQYTDYECSAKDFWFLYEEFNKAKDCELYEED